ncbi:hypothetical protein [Micromonospora sp. NBC_00617]|uniref:hypothetical protein n=1 Tax=Micromonospora sp. NBC_00617 TaxID=2903587 RepID=UPI0030DEF2E9
MVAATIRGSRSAGRLLTDRLAWLAAVTLAVILAAGQLLTLTGSYRSFPQALHDAALTTITGEPLGAGDTFAQILELVLAAYSVAVFGTLAGALGAFFLSRGRAEDEPVDRTSDRARQGHPFDPDRDGNATRGDGAEQPCRVTRGGRHG